MTEVWALPGYDVQALIGFGATGEVWRARELSTGETVALKRLRHGADPVAVEALRREAAVLRSLDTPYVVRLRAVLGEGADAVLVLDHAAGGSLAVLLTRRGSLDPAEVVTVAAPLAQALAAAHACGLVHGDVTPANILFTADGMPLLADLGLARLAVSGADVLAAYVDPAVASSGEPDEAADVWALAAVCHHMLSGTPPHDGESASTLDAARVGTRAPLGLLAPAAPRALVSAIEHALQPDTTLRPDAGAFASALRRSHAAAPVRLVDAVPVAAPGPAVRPAPEVHPVAPTGPGVAGPSRRRLALAGAALLLVVVAAVAGWLSGRSGPVQLTSVEAATPAPSPSVAAGSQSWSSVLDLLDRARADAFAAGDPARLANVYAPGSPLLSADRAAMARLAAAGQRARGVRHTIRSLAVSAHDSHVAVLRVVDELAAYQVVDGAGRVVSRAAPRTQAAFAVRLVSTPAGWRLQSITPA
ncbi:MAG: eukaryotic-like serine/threonine-protein kinase [Actinomycetota bacterium]|nr:eukaryotic-like serine/threonine-protein kinase [Actinomycetota bacterium]